jgi:hypothetical protein
MRHPQGAFSGRDVPLITRCLQTIRHLIVSFFRGQVAAAGLRRHIRLRSTKSMPDPHLAQRGSVRPPHPPGGDFPDFMGRLLNLLDRSAAPRQRQRSRHRLCAPPNLHLLIRMDMPKRTLASGACSAKAPGRRYKSSCRRVNHLPWVKLQAWELGIAIRRISRAWSGGEDPQPGCDPRVRPHPCANMPACGYYVARVATPFTGSWLRLKPPGGGRCQLRRPLFIKERPP